VSSTIVGLLRFCVSPNQERVESLGKLIVFIRAKKRAMSRRQTGVEGDVLMTMDTILSSAANLCSFLRVTTASLFGGEDALASMLALQTQGFIFHQTTTRKVVKMMVHDDLKFCRWHDLLTTTYQLIHEQLGSEPEADEFFGLQLAQVFQRLLKSVTPGAKAFQIKI
jgi:hypothetical protein